MYPSQVDLRWYHSDLVLTMFSTFLFFKIVGEIPSFFGKNVKKSANFDKFCQSSDVLAQLRVNFAQVRL